MLKHSEVKPEFTAKHIQDASEKLRVMNLDDVQRKAYDEYLQNVSYKKSMLWSSREEGKEEATITIARNLLLDHVAVEIIARSTGLTVDEIMRLQHEDDA
jgi:predicted transposase/invertase (TIGR01784 family)